MWLFGAPAKRGHPYSITGLMHEMKSGRIDSSWRRLLHLRILLTSWSKRIKFY